MAIEISDPSARARARARSSRLFCQTASMLSCWTRSFRARTTASSAAIGASIGIGTRATGIGSALARAIGPACFRRLRQRDQQRCLAEREPAGLLAEIGKRCGAHAFEIAAERGEAQVEIEHLI